MRDSSIFKSLGPHVRVEKGTRIPDSAQTAGVPFIERRNENAETQCLGIGSQARNEAK